MGLVDALVAHGIAGDAARAMEAEITPGEAIVTVETENRKAAEAIDILQRFGGRAEVSGAYGSSGDPSAQREYVETLQDDDELEMPVWEEEVFYVRGRR
jgi:hypothetical protein